MSHVIGQNTTTDSSFDLFNKAHLQFSTLKTKNLTKRIIKYKICMFKSYPPLPVSFQKRTHRAIDFEFMQLIKAENETLKHSSTLMNNYKLQ